MAPAWPYDTSATRITTGYNGGDWYGDYYDNSGTTGYSGYVESDQKRRDRISLEKLLASQKVYNDRTPTVKVIKQMCKPQHRISHGAYRSMR